MARQVAATVVRLMPRSLSRDAGDLMARYRGVFRTAPGPLCLDRPFSAGLGVLGEATRRAVGPPPGGHTPGQTRLVVAVGRSPWLRARVREKRPLPAAGAASDPTRMTPHEIAPDGIRNKSYRIKVEICPVSP